MQIYFSLHRIYLITCHNQTQIAFFLHYKAKFYGYLLPQGQLLEWLKDIIECAVTFLNYFIQTIVDS